MKKIVNIYIIYEINKKLISAVTQHLKNCLFGTIRLTENTDIGKYKYSGYGIGFDRHGFFFIP